MRSVFGIAFSLSITLKHFPVIWKNVNKGFVVQELNSIEDSKLVVRAQAIAVIGSFQKLL